MSDINSQYTRPPVVAIMGHVDHGKSTLLDTIRHTNTVDAEAGGITQHVSAYEVEHTTPEGVSKKITFIDTPGHAAFQGIRSRSASIADIAILIVAADDGVKPQTLQAWQTIQENNVPYLVAINKIDKPGSDIEKCIRELMEMGVYLEGYGGDVSYCTISAKQGHGINDLLETILLLSEFIDLSYNPSIPATGFVIESHIDTKRGIAATLLIKDGVLNKSDFVVTGCSIVPCRAIYNYKNKPIESATVCEPVTLYGFSQQCSAGEPFTTHHDKYSAETEAAKSCSVLRMIDEAPDSDEITIIPVIIKCDVNGSVDAVISEIRKRSSERVFFKIVHAGVGNISETDIRTVATDDSPLIIGFNVSIDPQAREMNEARTITIKTFNIIYRMSEWLEEIAEDRKFKKKVDSIIGSGQILKVFSQDKDQILIGVRVASGEFKPKDTFRIMRGREEVSRGKIISIQAGKSTMTKVEAGTDCGIMVQIKDLPRQFDIIEAVTQIDG
jgi:translation initiation factor IF-2